MIMGRKEFRNNIIIPISLRLLLMLVISWLISGMREIFNISRFALFLKILHSKHKRCISFCSQSSKLRTFSKLIKESNGCVHIFQFVAQNRMSKRLIKCGIFGMLCWYARTFFCNARLLPLLRLSLVLAAAHYLVKGEGENNEPIIYYTSLALKARCIIYVV